MKKLFRQRTKAGVSWRNTKYKEHLDDFPTPPWAVRAFFKYVAPELVGRHLTFLEPACGRGHMVQVLKEQRFRVQASDIKDYGRGFPVEDYLKSKPVTYDVMLTNPPYRHAQAFTTKALTEARVGVAILARTTWLEGATRFHELFDHRPPTTVAVFSRRMRATHGKLVRDGDAMMSHSWYWWNFEYAGETRLIWLPPTAQQELEKDSDYESVRKTKR